MTAQTPRFPLKTSERPNELILTACRKLDCSDTNNHNRHNIRLVGQNRTNVAAAKLLRPCRDSCLLVWECSSASECLSRQASRGLRTLEDAADPHMCHRLSAQAALRAIKNWSKSPAPLTKLSDKPLLKRNGGALCLKTLQD